MSVSSVMGAIEDMLTVRLTQEQVRGGEGRGVEGMGGEGRGGEGRGGEMG